ncbi:MAG: biopolymer transporter ExbD [Endomicrobium sp.]|jgi:biopolymer transport protein ExbD|nr:biopolymer transporter ExbD [Endomicrobium sp.]
MTIKRKRSTVMSEINITPFTDVMLVLLIIFMITTPMMVTRTSSIKVNLPKTQISSPDSESSSNSNIEVLISKDGGIYIEGKEIDSLAIEDIISNRISLNHNKVIILKGDKQVQYEHIIHFINKAKKAGATRFALAVDNTSIT